MTSSSGGASAPSFLTVWPDGERPNAPSLNPVLGQPPAPNAVTTPLSDSGEFRIFNAFGSVDVIVDLVGYYTPGPLETLTASMPFVEQAHSFEFFRLTGTATSTLIKAIDAPVPGTATVKGTLGVSHPVDGGDIRCSIVMVGVGGLDVNSPGYMRWESNRENTLGTVTGTRSFELPAPGGQGFATVCEEDDGDGALVSANLSILFTPA